MSSITHFSGKVYPDKSFSIGRTPFPKILANETRYNSQWEDQRDRYFAKYTENNRTIVRYGAIEVQDRKTLPALDLQKSEIITKKRGAYGRHGITKFGKRCVKNISLLLQQKYGKKCLGFGTATLPPMSPSKLKFICRNLGDIVRRFFQKLKRKMKAFRLPFEYCSVVEIQEKRFARTSQPYPHLHFVYRCSEAGDYNYFLKPSDFQEAWMRSIAEIFELRGYPSCINKSNFNASINVQVVKKSASAYIGKYMSKGVKVVDAMLEAGYKFLPKQWWSASHGCKQMFKESIIHLDSHTCKSFFYDLATYLDEGAIVWARFVEVEIHEEYRTMGLVGSFSHDAYIKLKEPL